MKQSNTEKTKYIPLLQTYKEGAYKPDASEKDPHQPKAAITYAFNKTLDTLSGPLDINLEDDKVKPK